MCIGLEEDQHCKDHSDCGPQLFCKKGDSFPYLSTCVSWVKLNTVCFDDFDCHPSLFCWYANAVDKGTSTKRCIERYAKPELYSFGWSASLNTKLSDQEYNGQHCTSGMAKNGGGDEAVCVKVTSVTQDSTTL